MGQTTVLLSFEADLIKGVTDAEKCENIQKFCEA